METSVYEEMAGEEISFFCGSSIIIQDHLLYYYKDKNNSFKYKYPVTDSYKIIPYKVIDVFISESKPVFGLRTSLTKAM